MLAGKNKNTATRHPICPNSSQLLNLAAFQRQVHSPHRPRESWPPINQPPCHLTLKRAGQQPTTISRAIYTTLQPEGIWRVWGPDCVAVWPVLGIDAKHQSGSASTSENQSPSTPLWDHKELGLHCTLDVGLQHKACLSLCLLKCHFENNFKVVSWILDRPAIPHHICRRAWCVSSRHFPFTYFNLAARKALFICSSWTHLTRQPCFLNE